LPCTLYFRRLPASLSFQAAIVGRFFLQKRDAKVFYKFEKLKYLTNFFLSQHILLFFACRMAAVA
jgi:hypothetical protein